MGYSSAEISDLFDYDFTSCGGPKGKTPEPTDAEIEKFRNVLLDLQLFMVGMTREEYDEDEATKEGAEFSKRLGAVTHEQKRQLGEDLREAIIEFCHGSPSREAIMALPGLQVVGYANHMLTALSPLL